MEDQNRIVSWLCDMARIDSPSCHERDMADWMTERLRELGADEIKEDQAGGEFNGNCGNLEAVFNATGEGMSSIALAGHLDCVEVCRGVIPSVDNGVVHSAGHTILGADDKAGLAAVLEGLHKMKEQNIPHGRISFLMTVHEEGGVRGSRAMDRSFLKGIDYAYVLDVNGEPGSICIGAPGQMQIHLEMTGRSAHAGVEPQKGISAVMMMVHTLAGMKTGWTDEETTFNVGRICGGTAVNVVPPSCTAETAVRSLKEEKMTALREDLENRCRITESAFPGGTARAASRLMYHPFRMEEKNPCVRLAAEAVRSAGLTPRFFVSGGGSDANWYNRFGVPSILLGIGMEGMHTNEEYIRISDLRAAGKLVYRLICQAAEKS